MLEAFSRVPNILSSFTWTTSNIALYFPRCAIFNFFYSTSYFISSPSQFKFSFIFIVKSRDFQRWFYVLRQARPLIKFSEPPRYKSLLEFVLFIHTNNAAFIFSWCLCNSNIWCKFACFYREHLIIINNFIVLIFMITIQIVHLIKIALFLTDWTLQYILLQCKK